MASELVTLKSSQRQISAKFQGRAIFTVSSLFHLCRSQEQYDVVKASKEIR